MLKEGIIGLGIVAVVSFAATAGADSQPAGAPALEAFAKGVQIYGCSQSSGGGYAWSLKGPDAILHDGKGTPIGKHFAGPTWQANDGSTVVGEPMNATPSPRDGAVAWLLLRAKSHEGAGQMASVAYIVRTNTKGGTAPPTGCDATHAGDELRVPYSATYLFFRG